MNQCHLILEPVMSSSKCMRCLSPALLSLRLTVTGARKGFLESKGLEVKEENVKKHLLIKWVRYIQNKINDLLWFD